LAAKGVEDRIRELREALEKAKQMRIQAETRLEELARQEGEILRELEALGVKPENLAAEIERLDREIAALLEQAESLLPWDLVGRGGG
jgi:chromosome segregation ATPase